MVTHHATPARPLASPRADLHTLREALRERRYMQAMDIASRAPSPESRARWHGEILVDALASCRVPLAHAMLERGAHPDGFIDEISLLAHAIRYQHTDIAEHLIGAGADVNAQLPNADALMQRNWTALMWAVQERDLAMARRLLAQGADVHARNARGRGAADIALAGARPSPFISLLLAHGLDPERPGPQGVRLAEAAHAAGHPDVAEMIRAHRRAQAVVTERAEGTARPTAAEPHL